jgi:hypothetical protein
VDANLFKRWCCANIIWPGIALVDSNETSDPCIVTCHAPAPQEPTTSVFFRMMQEHWLIILVVSLAIVTALGVVLAVNHMRWRRLLREQLEAGHIDEEQYERLR